MTSGCLDRKEVRGAIWGVHSTTDRPAGGNTGRVFLAFGGPVCADRISNCPLDRVLTYKNLIISRRALAREGDYEMMSVRACVHACVCACVS